MKKRDVSLQTPQNDRVIVVMVNDCAVRIVRCPVDCDVEILTNELVTEQKRRQLEKWYHNNGTVNNPIQGSIELDIVHYDVFPLENPSTPQIEEL